LIVSDGALQYIPFAALPNPTTVQGSVPRPLVVNHEIVSLPSASTLSVLRREVAGRKPAPKAVAVTADPVYNRNDERIKGEELQSNRRGMNRPTAPRTRGELPFELERSARESGLRGGAIEFTRLKGTGYEARQILSLVPESQSKQSFGFNADMAAVTAPDLSQYRYVHFATHGLLNSTHPELSGLVLTLFDREGNPRDGFLRANQIFNLKLPAELVVLSACQTGLGKEVKGEGLVSLTRGFMYAGAPRVVVSLWSVPDAATAELMARFYRKMLKEGLRPAAALRAAQVSIIEDSQKKDWVMPYYWAAFTLQGEWR
jgi:CHAT domain-containing protein